jgi:predicted permease
MLADWVLRLRSLLKRNAVEQELDDELRFHFERLMESRMREGLAQDEAIRRARIELGAFDQIKEEHRDARGTRLVDDLGRDVRYALRQLRRSPGFALAALLCLGIGIGATTAIYSVVDTILLQPLPFPDSDRLVRVVENFPSVAPGRPLMQRGITHREFAEWRTHARTLSDATAIIPMGQRMVRTSDGAAGLWGAMTSANMFALLGVRAMLGRTLVSSDDANPDVVVLSFDTWRQHFNADQAVVGTALEFRAGALLGPTPARWLTVVGVLPADFEFPTGPLDFYMPFALDPSRPSPRVTTIARLAPGVSLEAAIHEANAMGNAIRPPWPADAPTLTRPRFEVQRLKDLAVQRLRPALRVLFATVIVVLLIACANVANLLLARGTARQREMLVRLAIGASRARIMRQIMTECLVLAIAGGALGSLLAASGIALVKQLATVEAPGIFRLMFGATILPRAREVGIDINVFGIALSIAAVTSIVFGALPALHLSRTHHVHAMGSRGSGTAPKESRIRATLVISQLVMATVLLVGAGLLTQSFIKLSAVDNGYNPSNVLAINLLFPDQYSIARRVETIGTLLERFRGTANVTSAGFSRHGLLIGEQLTIGTFVPPGRSLEEMRATRARVRSVSDGYLTAMGVPLLDGREFEPGDDAMAPPVIVMNRSAARRYFGTGNPVGQVVDWHVGKERTQMHVVGVVEDVRQVSPTDEVYPEVFVEYRQLVHLLASWGEPTQRQNEMAIGFLSFALRTHGDPASVVQTVRKVVSGVDPSVGIDALVPMDRLVASSVAHERFYAVTIGVFAALAGLLAAIGIYGVLSYSVIQRTQEIGIRMALGAQRTQVLANVLRKGLILSAVGIALGLVGAAAGTRLLQGLLFGLTPLDTRTFLVVSLMFGFVATLASYLPARRATRVDPMVALRSE